MGSGRGEKLEHDVRTQRSSASHMILYSEFHRFFLVLIYYEQIVMNYYCS